MCHDIRVVSKEQHAHNHNQRCHATDMFTNKLNRKKKKKNKVQKAR